jgi:acetoin:2,6-dichlorophenolindophenol oxidoreductase subunit alpha
MAIDNNQMLDIYKKLLLARLFEERVHKLTLEGVVLGSVHLSIGEEASSVGTISALKKEDYILPTHRGHAQHLAKGADPSRLLAELAGKETGYCKGISGSIHIFDSENNNLGSNGIVGAQFPIAVGAGLAIKYKKMKSIVACFFGDGSSNQGWFYELLNLSSIWNLPVAFVCINNLYGMGTPYYKTSLAKVHEKAIPFKIKTDVVDGNDVYKVYKKMKTTVEYIRENSKPALLECLTYRWMGHSGHDQRSYRSINEINEWKAKDPVKIAEKQLLKQGILKEKIDDLLEETNALLDKAEKFAKESNFAEFSDGMQL